MSLFEDTKIALGVTSNTRDAEIQMLIESAKEHLKARDLLTGDEGDDEIDGLRRNAIVAYVKANFGFDNADMNKFNSLFKRIVCDLLNTDGVN